MHRLNHFATRRLLIVCVIAIAGMASVPAESASRRWVTDRLEVDMRRGKSMEFAIVKMVPSGTPVDLLEQDRGNGYSRVRLVTGAEGWILSRYLVDDAPARSAVPELRTRAEQAEGKLALAEQSVEALRSERDRMATELDAAVTEARSLRDINHTLSTRSNQQWFVVGAGAVIAGLLMGLILPRINWKRRRSGWDSF